MKASAIEGNKTSDQLNFAASDIPLKRLFEANNIRKAFCLHPNRFEA